MIRLIVSNVIASYFLLLLSIILRSHFPEKSISKKSALLSSKVLLRKKKKKKEKCVQSKQKFERKTCHCDVIKFKLAMFYRGELSEYSYHVGEQAVLAKYSSCVPITWTMKERGRVRKQEVRKERTKVGLLGYEGIRNSVHGCGMAARYRLNNITEMTRVAIGFYTFSDLIYCWIPAEKEIRWIYSPSEDIARGSRSPAAFN